MANVDDTKTEKDLDPTEANGNTPDPKDVSQDTPGNAQVENEQTVAAQSGENGKEKPFAFSDLDKASAVQPPGNIVHWPTTHGIVLINGPVFYSQNRLGILGCHSEESGDPHPENRSRPTGGYGSCHPGYVARADGS